MIKEFLSKYGIDCVGAIPLSRCKITKQYLLDRSSLGENSSVIMMLLPYRSEHMCDNLSAYASVRDYHAFTDALRTDIKLHILSAFPDARCELFADHSPIDEVNGACLCGLGFIGDNGLLINEKYSSFVFLCELITDLSPESLGLEFTESTEVKRCFGCGACHRACPSHCMDESDPRPKSECLSAITQKKGELSDSEIALMLENKSAWGCDVCQNVCPYTKNASFTPIEFFKNGVIHHLSSADIENMSDSEFASRPFAWRGKAPILRNLRLFEENTNKH
jgi:epoxyqueuosine reductase